MVARWFTPVALAVNSTAVGSASAENVRANGHSWKRKKRDGSHHAQWVPRRVSRESVVAVQRICVGTRKGDRRFCHAVHSCALCLTPVVSV